MKNMRFVKKNHAGINAGGWQVNIGSSNGLLPLGNKPLPEPVLTHVYVTIRRDWDTINVHVDIVFGELYLSYRELSLSCVQYCVYVFVLFPRVMSVGCLRDVLVGEETDSGGGGWGGKGVGAGGHVTPWTPTPLRSATE